MRSDDIAILPEAGSATHTDTHQQRWFDHLKLLTKRPGNEPWGRPRCTRVAALRRTSAYGDLRDGLFLRTLVPRASVTSAATTTGTPIVRPGGQRRTNRVNRARASRVSPSKGGDHGADRTEDALMAYGGGHALGPAVAHRQRGQQQLLMPESGGIVVGTQDGPARARTAPPGRPQRIVTRQPIGRRQHILPGCPVRLPGKKFPHISRRPWKPHAQSHSASRSHPRSQAPAVRASRLRGHLARRALGSLANKNDQGAIICR